MSMEKRRRALMNDMNLYNPSMMGEDQRFGPIKGYGVGYVFNSRMECCDAGVHPAPTAGIYGADKLGAFSICLSGGYADDQDDGDFVVYTGTGGHRVEDDSGAYHASGPQVEDQTFSHPHNAWLKKSSETGKPVRLIRGPNPKSRYAPESGYRYDGLYVVEQAFYDKGVSGLTVCKYHLRRVPDQDELQVKSST